MPNDRFVSSRWILMLAAFLAGSASTTKPVTAAPMAASEAYGRLPLHFEANLGQTHEDVRFLARGPGYSLYLTAGEAVLVLTKPGPDAKRDARSTPERLNTQAREAPVVVRMSLVGAAPKPLMSGLDELPGKANYFIGNDPAKWRTNVPTYAKVRYREVYPGIDLVYYGNQRQLEYDFVVAPGADPKRIVLGFQGAERLEINAEGEFVLYAAGGALRQRKPVIHQEIDGVRTEIEGRYVLKDPHRVGFQVAAYDQSKPLVIDPTLVYSTYLGGSGGDVGFGIAVDAAGSAYLTGFTDSANFPTASPLQAALNGGFRDAFVSKLNAAGSTLLYSTYLGGSGVDEGFGIAVDAAGSAYVTGFTGSANFPTVSPLQAALGGGFDAFVSKLNATGSALLYSTYLGGSGVDEGRAIAVDAAGSAYVTGRTGSANFPTASPMQAANGGIDDAFVSKLNATGSALLYSTYLGGSGEDEGFGIAVDTAGSAYVTGRTGSANFPTASPMQAASGGNEDAFVSKLNAAGSALVYSTYLGGSGQDEGFGIAVDTTGSAYVTGFTVSANFPTANPLQAASGGGFDAFVSKLNAAGSTLLYSTYLGGSGGDEGFGIAVDIAGSTYVTGVTASTNFPTANPLQAAFGGDFDAFVSKITDVGLPASTPGTVSLGGFIDSAGNLVGGSVLLLQNGPVPGGKATFGGHVQFQSGDPSPTGNVRYIDHVTGDDIKATSFTTLVIGAGPCGSDTHALIIGKATVNKVPDQDLRLDVDDCSAPGAKQPSTPDMLVIMTGPAQSYTNGGPLVEGDIKVEKTQ